MALQVVLLSLLTIPLLTSAQTPPTKQQPVSNGGLKTGVIRTSSSPFAKLHDVPIPAVQLDDGFWRTRLTTNARTSIPDFLASLEKAGALDKLRGRPHNARGNSDADVGKWIEAASWALQSEDNPELRRLLDRVLESLMAASEPGGYLHTQYAQRMPAALANLKGTGHLYCLGHLLQAAIACSRATGDERLLNVLASYVDRLIERFGPGRQLCWSGHPNIEMALVELYRTTGQKRYLDFARYLILEVDLRKVPEAREIDWDHYVAGVPFPSHSELRGHAVCALYACCGAADYYLETGDADLWRTLGALWRDLTQHKMYVTGGVGSLPSTEAIGHRYDLPNERGYAETCAAIANVMWNWRLLNTTGEARFADTMELALYNGFLSGVSLDGRRYFYWNPLLSRVERTGVSHPEGSANLLASKKANGVGLDVRQTYFQTPCCLPNVQRVLAALPGYLYSTSPEGVWVHLYHNSRLAWRSEAGEEIVLIQNTKYPWTNTVEITVERAPAGALSLFLRIPYWSTGTTINLNGKPFRALPESSVYCEIQRRWSNNDRVEITFEMPIRAVYPHPRLRENAGCLALQRGPVLYCLESVDHPNMSIFDIVLPVDAAGVPGQCTATFEPDLLGGVVTLNVTGWANNSPPGETRLYDFQPRDAPMGRAPVKAIPYFAWANRGPCDMTVWVPWMRAQ
jgi:uncharacterized protein